MIVTFGAWEGGTSSQHDGHSAWNFGCEVLVDGRVVGMLLSDGPDFRLVLDDAEPYFRARSRTSAEKQAAAWLLQRREAREEG
jgi:hypothetical protein